MLLGWLGGPPGATAQGAAREAGSGPDSAGPRYLLPDLSPDALVFDGAHLWVRPIFAVIGDYSWFSQDDASLGQVGAQADQADLRAGLAPERLQLSFHRAELGFLLFGVLIGAVISGDGRGNWFKGVQLVTVYAMIALMLSLVPGASP